METDAEREIYREKERERKREREGERERESERERDCLHMDRDACSAHVYVWTRTRRRHTHTHTLPVNVTSPLNSLINELIELINDVQTCWDRATRMSFSSTRALNSRPTP
jgi:hypothetical protein